MLWVYISMKVDNPYLISCTKVNVNKFYDEACVWVYCICWDLLVKLDIFFMIFFTFSTRSIE